MPSLQAYGFSQVLSVLKTILKRAAQLLCISFVLALLYFSPNIYHIYQWNPVLTPLSSLFYGEAESVIQAQSEDIEFLRKLPSIDRSFSQQNLQKFQTILTQLEQSAGQYSEAEFSLEVARAVAMADNGHTNLSQRDLLSRFNRLPFRFYWFGDDLHVVRAHPEHGEWLGRKVIKIADQPIDEVINIANQYFGGPNNWRRYLSTAILESPELLAASKISPSAERVSLTFADENEIENTLLFEALPKIKEPDFSGRFPWMVLSPNPFPEEDIKWLTVGDNWAKAPLRFMNPNTPYQFQLMADGTGLYVRLDLMLNYADNNIELFWASLQEEIKDKQFEFVLLDFRNSPGGDFTNSVEQVRRLTQHLTPKGTIYIATSQATFSAAIVNASVAKFHGKDQAVIIGERVGDRDQFWAEGGFPFRLPHSKLTISFATAYHDWVNGCTGSHPYCFSMNEAIENPISSLDPAVELPYRFEDFVAGNNPILDYVSRHPSRR